MEALVGYTGFVGFNITAKHKFDKLYNSANIMESFGTNPDLLVYAGVPSAMFLANNDPEADLAVIKNAASNIRKINPKRLVLISTIAVLDNPIGTAEDTVINKNKLTAYGYNRLYLEEAAREFKADCHIIRLPALFGKNIKKNFIYDFIHFLPAMLTSSKFTELSAQEPIIKKYYLLEDNGFYKLQDGRNLELRAAFERLGFSALTFTDSRSVFQFYNLNRLWSDIKTVIKYDISLLHTAVEPTSVNEVYEYLTGIKFVNETLKPFNYDYRTKYDGIFGGQGGYCTDKQNVLKDIMNFVKEEANENETFDFKYCLDERT